MDANQLARRIEEMRTRVQDIEGLEGLPEAAVRELLLAVEELRVVEEELRQQNEAMEAAQQQLEDERRRYQHLFQYAPDAYLLTDLSGILGT